MGKCIQEYPLQDASRFMIALMCWLNNKGHILPRDSNKQKNSITSSVSFRHKNCKTLTNRRKNRINLNEIDVFLRRRRIISDLCFNGIYSFTTGVDYKQFPSCEVGGDTITFQEQLRLMPDTMTLAHFWHRVDTSKLDACHLTIYKDICVTLSVICL